MRIEQGLCIRFAAVGSADRKYRWIAVRRKAARRTAAEYVVSVDPTSEANTDLLLTHHCLVFVQYIGLVRKISTKLQRRLIYCYNTIAVTARPRRAHSIDAVYCYRPGGVVCLRVCLCVLFTGSRPWTLQKMVELIDMYGIWCRWGVRLVGPRNHVLDEGTHRIGGTWWIRYACGGDATLFLITLTTCYCHHHHYHHHHQQQ